MNELIPPELEEDSEDLTDAEVESAVLAKNVDAVIEYLKKFRCRTCKQNVGTEKHALRRRAPYFYTRMTVKCAEGHEDTVVFRADWLSS